MRLKCPACHAEMDLDVLLAHEESRHVLAQLVTLALPLGRLLLAYVGLFRPGKRALSMSRTLAILAEVIADIQRGHITRKGRDWTTTQAQWQAAIEQVLAARDKGTLTPPLTGHGYLHEVLLTMVDKAEAAAEKEREADRRGRAHVGGTASVADVIAGIDHSNAARSVAPPPVVMPAPAGPSAYAKKVKAEIAAKLGRRASATPEEQGAPDEHA
jgi:hypothetical protein